MQTKSDFIRETLEDYGKFLKIVSIVSLITFVLFLLMFLPIVIMLFSYGI